MPTPSRRQRQYAGYLPSDNGPTSRSGDTAPTADGGGQKADIWEGGHCVPFIARWPDTIRAGSTRTDLVCLTDLFATVAAIPGASSLEFGSLTSAAPPRQVQLGRRVTF